MELKAEYVNIHGEIMKLKTVGEAVHFNHSDVHDDDVYEALSGKVVVFDSDEREFISTFFRMAEGILNARNK